MISKTSDSALSNTNATREHEKALLEFHFGPTSDVLLKTTYLDDQVRLGVGGRGSLFIFKRISEETFRNSIESSPPTLTKWKANLAFAAIAVTLFVLKNQYRSINQKWLSALLLFLTVTVLALPILYVLRNGGILRDDKSGVESA